MDPCNTAACASKDSKLHLAVDTVGYVLALHVAASVYDRAEVGRLIDAAVITIIVPSSKPSILTNGRRKKRLSLQSSATPHGEVQMPQPQVRVHPGLRIICL
jgi:hypothetical protein